MGCNCKKVEEVNHILKVANGNTQVEKKGISFYLQGIVEVFVSIAFRLLGVVLTIIISPIIIACLIIKFLLGETLGIKIPKSVIDFFRRASNGE